MLMTPVQDFGFAMPVEAVRPTRRLVESAIRLVDLSGALLGLLFFAPLMLIVAAVIGITDPGPIFYRQSRVGRSGIRFRCLKFRTMVVDSDSRLKELLSRDPAARLEWALNQKLLNDPRITRIGRFLRKSSLDELPQLFNVLRGEMSLVGPRPIVADEIVRYGRYYGDYTRVRPGLTGLWQVSGRNSTTYRRRVAMDVIYTRRRSLRMNMRIVLMTVPAVLVAKGCS
jgi:exopolysaccharide production protein ExoY